MHTEIWESGYRNVESTKPGESLQLCSGPGSVIDPVVSDK